MEALLLVFNLIVFLLLLLWSARTDPVGRVLSGHGLFDTKPGAECDHRKRPDFSPRPPV